MHALFVGGVIDNKEVDLEDGRPPVHYPENSGGGHSRYRLHFIGEGDGGRVVYAVYGAPDLPDSEVARVVEERAYARRFDAQAVQPPELSGPADVDAADSA